MTSQPAAAADPRPRAHVDVLIVGAGISGIGAACHLQERRPDTSYEILEARDSFGGTWDLFRFPGIRSDSDLYTFGYRFKPWHGKPIATAAEIKRYLEETIAEHRLGERIHYGHRIESAAWSSGDAVWTVQATRIADGEPLTFTCGFLWMCQGYYSYARGYLPELPGLDRFTGTVVHPQAWPEDLDYAGKQVVVIGSGSTAVTLVPAMAKTVGHLVILQRSPSYVAIRPNRSELAELLDGLDLPEAWVHEILRRRYLKDSETIARMAREQPERLREQLIGAVREALPGFDVDTHFNPSYMPWKQRLCIAPDGDLFEAIRSGKVSMVTDHIETFTEDGVRLRSGDTLEADIVVCATGLELCALGEIPLEVDGAGVDPASAWTYRGIMLSDVPNLAFTFGYIRSSWTLRADLVADFVCRLLAHMDEQAVSRCTPRLRAEDADMARRSFIDAEDFSPGYMNRAMARFPAQGDREPWTNSQDYFIEKVTLPGCSLDDGVLVFDTVDERPTARLASEAD